MMKKSILLVALSVVLFVSSCANDIPPVPDTENLTETDNLTPVTVDADEGAYTSYALPYEEDISEEDQETLKERVYSDGMIHYVMQHMDQSKQLVIDRVFTFNSFISLCHGTYERPYLFETGLPLKICVASADNPSFFYGEAYVPLPAVFGAFRDLILSRTFTDTDKDSIQDLRFHTFVSFKYGEDDYYYIYDTGDVFCGARKSETLLSAEETVLFLAYKFAFIYASVLGGGHYISYDLGYSLSADFVVAIKENGIVRYLENKDAREFVVDHSIINEMHPAQGEYLYLQDVNLKDADYGPILYEFRICRDKDEDLSNVTWFEFHEGGQITHHGWAKWEMVQLANPQTVQGFIVSDITAVFTERFET